GRLLASYSRPWITKGVANPHAVPPQQRDFCEPYRVGGRTRYWSKVWNHIPRGSDYTWFIQAPEGTPMHDDPLCEIGCPYAVRGFDFDHTGLLWLSDLVWRGRQWQVNANHVHDTGLTRSIRAARDGGADEAPGLLRALRKAYRILLTR